MFKYNQALALVSPIKPGQASIKIITTGLYSLFSMIILNHVQHFYCINYCYFN